MEYNKAKKIREQSFGTLLAEHGGGLGSSLKAVISQKTQAKMTGMQEKFDPMNIAKFMTFGSNFAPALLGKLTGRKQSSIDYFSGVKRRGKGTAERLGKIEGGGTGDVLGILHSIESLLHKTREDDKLKAEQEKNFEEERNLEKARRHKELMKAITGKPYTEKIVPTAVKEEPPETKSFLDNLLDFFGDLKLISALGSRVPLLAFILGLYLAKKQLDETKYGESMNEGQGKIAQKAFREKQTDFSKFELTQDNAKAILEQPEGKAKERDISSFGGIERIKAIAEGKPDPGGVAPKQKTFEENRQEILKDKVEPRPEGTSGKIKAKQSVWDEKYSKDYNIDGTKKSATPIKSKTEMDKQEALKNELVSKQNKEIVSSESISKETPKSVLTTPTPTETPKSGVALNQVQKTNLDLNLPQFKSDPSTVVNNNVNNVSKGGKPRGIIPLVRNNEETLQRLIFNSTRVV
jgi:hypothetical protein